MNLSGTSAFEQRRHTLLAQLVSEDYSKDLYGRQALLNLACQKHSASANEKLRIAAQWFTRPHPKGRDPQGECDFVAMKLTWAYYRFGQSGLLEPATLEAIKAYFLTYDFQSKYTSENHVMLFHTSRYLMGIAYPNEVFGRYGIRGETLAQLEKDYLADFIRFRARQGWDEFDSGNYFAPIWECLCALHDFAPDEDVRLLAKMMMNVRLADMSVDVLDGMYCGAHGRIYERQALDHSNECTYFLQHLYFGNVTSKQELALAEALLCSFQPDSIIEKILLERNKTYETRERVHLHCSTYLPPERPLPQEAISLRKITRISPRYALGCVQWQDAYAEGSLAAWHTGHQQHEWDLTLAGNDTKRRIFTHHPGHSGTEGAEHGYWTGDMLCNCGAHFQHHTAVLALYDIPATQTYGFIHAYVPKERFEQMVEQDGAIFLRQGAVYIMLRLLRPYRWTAEGAYAGCEVISDGRRNGAVCEVGECEEFGSFDAFISHMLKNPVSLDEERMTLTYRSRRNGVLTLSRHQRLIDGNPADLDYPAFDSPYLYAAWDSGIVHIRHGHEELYCDFMAPMFVRKPCAPAPL